MPSNTSTGLQKYCQQDLAEFLVLLNSSGNESSKDLHHRRASLCQRIFSEPPFACQSILLPCLLLLCKKQNFSFVDQSIDVIGGSVLLSVVSSTVLDIEFKCLQSVLLTPPTSIEAAVGNFDVIGKIHLSKGKR